MTEVDLDKLKELMAEAMPQPWFYNGYSALFSLPMNEVHDDWWTEERFNDGHTYDSRVGETCPACGKRPVLIDGKDTGRVYWDCARSHEADDVEPVAATVPASYGDTATGTRAANARLIEEAINSLPEMIAELERSRRVFNELGLCTGCSGSMPCIECGRGL